MSGLSLVPAPIAHLPWRLLFLVCAIGTFSSMVLYSASGGHLKPWALPQAVRFGAFLLMAIGMSYIRPETYKAATFPAYAIVVVMLILVELLGFVGGGAQRWLNLGFIRLQPSEFMKPIIVLAAAHFYAMLPAGETRRLGAIWPAAALIGFPAALIQVQPDLGTASMVAFSGLAVMFLAGLPLRLFVGGAAAIAVVVPVAFQFLHDYQQRRVLIFMNPDADPLGAGYHISQSKIAIGSGGIFGKGFLNGTQSHLDYLPEGHTDFVFATMSEEWGLAGGLVLIFAFAMVIRWAMAVALSTRGRFERLTAAGLAATLFFYVAVNLMMVMGLAPVVGIPLPIFSYGGSAQLTFMICLGILMSIDRNNRRERQRGGGAFA
jgi:rod shape determining protein RodA